MILFALHSSGYPESFWRDYEKESQLIALFSGYETQRIGGDVKVNTWQELAQIVNSASLVIATDNGILAIALALGKPAVAIFGGTDEDCIVWQFKKYRSMKNVRVVRSNKKDVCIRPCNFQEERGFAVNGKCSNKNADCMNEILPEEIFNAALNLIN